MAVTRRTEPWSALLEAGRSDDRLVREAYEGARAPVFAEMPADLHPTLVQGLANAGIDALYTHQAQALREAWEATTIVTTGTASGKSLCFNLPTLEVLCTDAKARALYLYPTKALAQDQARALNAFGLAKQVRPAIYDGDTRREERQAIRRRSNLVLTNPDMLHVGILPNHAAWADFFANLAVVVVDEAHVYRGVFGAHVANVLRRLRRVAAAYGTAPRFLLASATIANPVELAERLTGFEDVRLVDEDGSPGAKRQIAMWNPPVIDEALQLRGSALSEAADIVAELVREDARTICFIKSRKAVELVARIVREKLGPELEDRVAPYRAGYTPQQRRELEARLTSGELLAVITTDALELGIDIGALDAAVCVTFPGTVASLRQMWGRAGRRGRGLAVYVAGEDALDQFFCRHPDEFLERPVEVGDRLARERADPPRPPALRRPRGPARRARRRVPGPALAGLRGPARLPGRRSSSAAASTCCASPRTTPRRACRCARRRPTASPWSTSPAASCWARSRPRARPTRSTTAPSTCTSGAPMRCASSTSTPAARSSTPSTATGTRSPSARPTWRSSACSTAARRSGVTLSFGRVTVTEQVHAYQRKRLPDHEVLDLNGVDLPPHSFTTQALWYELGEDLLEEFPRELLLGALHAAEHTQIAVLPLLAMCDRWDIGGLSTNFHPQTGRPTIFIYDGHPGGVGITLQGFRNFDVLVEDAHRLIGECPCESGCPSCVQSPKCGNLNEPLSKAGAAEVMARMLQR